MISEVFWSILTLQFCSRRPENFLKALWNFEILYMVWFLGICPYASLVVLRVIHLSVNSEARVRIPLRALPFYEKIFFHLKKKFQSAIKTSHVALRCFEDSTELKLSTLWTVRHAAEGQWNFDLTSFGGRCLYKAINHVFEISVKYCITATMYCSCFGEFCLEQTFFFWIVGREEVGFESEGWPTCTSGFGYLVVWPWLSGCFHVIWPPDYTDGQILGMGQVKTWPKIWPDPKPFWPTQPKQFLGKPEPTCSNF